MPAPLIPLVASILGRIGLGSVARLAGGSAARSMLSAGARQAVSSGAARSLDSRIAATKWGGKAAKWDGQFAKWGGQLSKLITPQRIQQAKTLAEKVDRVRQFDSTRGLASAMQNAAMGSGRDRESPSSTNNILGNVAGTLSRIVGAMGGSSGRGGSGGSGGGGSGGSSPAAASPDDSGPSNSEVLKRGTNFGDIMGGRKTLSDAKQEVDAEQKAAEKANGLGKAVTSLLGPFGKAISATAGFVKGVDTLGSVLVERQRGLAEFNGTIAAAMAKLDAGRMRLDIQRGAGTARSTAALASAKLDLDKAIAPFGIAMTNGINRAVTMLTKVATGVTTIVSGIPGLKGLLEKMSKDEKGDLAPWQDFLSRMANGKMNQPVANNKVPRRQGGER